MEFQTVSIADSADIAMLPPLYQDILDFSYGSCGTSGHGNFRYVSGRLKSAKARGKAHSFELRLQTKIPKTPLV